MRAQVLREVELGSENGGTISDATAALDDLSSLSLIMQRAQRSHLDRVLRLPTISGYHEIAKIEATRRLEVLPSTDDLKRWLLLTENALETHCTPVQAKIISAFLLDANLRGTPRNPESFLELAAMSFAPSISTQLLAMAVRTALAECRTVPTVAQIHSLASKHRSAVIRFRTVIRQASNLRRNAEAVISRGSVARIADLQTRTGG